jgi:hypothetical protein
MLISTRDTSALDSSSTEIGVWGTAVRARKL